MNAFRQTKKEINGINAGQRVSFETKVKQIKAGKFQSAVTLTEKAANATFALNAAECRLRFFFITFTL